MVNGTSRQYRPYPIPHSAHKAIKDPGTMTSAIFPKRFIFCHSRFSVVCKAKIMDSKEADIRIKWVENLETVEGAPPGVAGYASPMVSDDRYVKVDIVLEVGNYQGKAWRQYGDGTMLSVAKHEF